MGSIPQGKLSGILGYLIRFSIKYFHAGLIGKGEAQQVGGGDGLHSLKSKKGFSWRSLTTVWVGYSINWGRPSYHIKSVTK